MRYSSVFSQFRVLFCHGLGSYTVDLQPIQHWANNHRSSVVLHRMNYKNYNRRDVVWNVDDWTSDLVTELSRSRTNQRGTIVVCTSASSQAFLNAIVALQKFEPDSIRKILGVLLISSAIGMEVENYVNRVLPDVSKELYRGEVVQHPSVDESVIFISLRALEDYSKNCVTRRDIQLPELKCPMRIVHGIHDKLVPYTNAIELFERINSPNKELLLVNGGHIITNQDSITYSLNSLLGAIRKQILLPVGANSEKPLLSHSYR